MGSKTRKTPEHYLNLISEDEQTEKGRKGYLKIFLGYIAGVGKTYRMLGEAQILKNRGEDVVCAVVETHGRADTEKLLEGLPQISAKTIEYAGITLQELDIDAVISRKPKYVLIDELAHTNAPGSRHDKRYQDIEEILNAGINVYTCVNIQHIENINDLIFRITGVRVKETVPNRILEKADKIELIDLPPDEIRQRLKEGKVYIPEKAKLAAQQFFKQNNLLALREIALRYTANRVDEEIITYRKSSDIYETVPEGSKLLVAVSSSPSSEELIRLTHRYADELRANWFAVYVQSPQEISNSGDDAARLDKNLHLAESLGAIVVRLSGERISDEIIAFAKEKLVRFIIIGYSKRSLYDRIMHGNVIDRIVKKSAPLHVLVAPGAKPIQNQTPIEVNRRKEHYAIKLIKSILTSIASVTIMTALIYPLKPLLKPTELAFFFIIPIVISGVSSGLFAGIVATVLSVLCYNYFYTQPYFTFYIDDARLVIIFLILLFVGIITSVLSNIVKRQSLSAKERELFITTLYDLSKVLLTTSTFDDLIKIIMLRLSDIFNAEVQVLLPSEGEELSIVHATSGASVLDKHDIGIAQWTYIQGEYSGFLTNTFSSSSNMYIPLKIKQDKSIGVIALTPRDKTTFLSYEKEKLLNSMINIVSLSIERIYYSKTQEKIKLAEESERIHQILLNTVSHELRTPITTISTAANALVDKNFKEKADLRSIFANDIIVASDRLNRIVDNLLGSLRIDNKNIGLNLEWYDISELISHVHNKLNKLLEKHKFTVRVDDNIPMVKFDFMLMDQLLTNLIYNAVLYTPVDSKIELSVEKQNSFIILTVKDNGPGIFDEDKKKIFNKFYRVRDSKSGGLGLGLYICKEIAEIHNGNIRIEDNKNGGASFIVKLQLEQSIINGELNE